MGRAAGRSGLIDEVASLLMEVSSEVIEWRFAELGAGEVRFKSPGEVVTVADEEAERMLAERLSALVPAPVVGEEACSEQPSLLDALGCAERAWLVDPLDGTANFVAGSPDWALMVALVEGGHTVASWIWQPPEKNLYVAEAGAGAALNGRPLAVGPAGPDAAGRGGGPAPSGAVLRRFLGPETVERVDRAAEEGRMGPVGPGRYCAGVEYPLVIDGSQDYVLFWRTLPWDHAPGVLLVREAGGVARRPDGSDYRVTDRDGRGLLAAGDAGTWERVREVVFG